MKRFSRSANSGLLISFLISAVCFGCTSKMEVTETNTKQEATATSSVDESNVDTGKYVKFPAAGIKMIQPDGFELAENFHGFQQLSTGSAVMVARIPGPFSEASEGFSVDNLKQRGMEMKSREELSIEGISAILLNVKQAAYGTEFEKWVIIFGNEKETKIVTASFPEAGDSALSKQLKNLVLGVKVDDSPIPDPHSDVGFKMSASDKLKLTSGAVMGKMLVYTKDGSIPMKSPDDPLFIAGPSFGAVPIGDRKQFVVNRLSQTAETEIISITANNEISIDGLDGYELIADAKDKDSGTALVVYLVLLFDKDNYFLMQGLVGASMGSEYLIEFKTMAKSLVREQD